MWMAMAQLLFCIPGLVTSVFAARREECLINGELHYDDRCRQYSALLAERSGTHGMDTDNVHGVPSSNYQGGISIGESFMQHLYSDQQYQNPLHPSMADLIDLQVLLHFAFVGVVLGLFGLFLRRRIGKIISEHQRTSSYGFTAIAVVCVGLLLFATILEAEVSCWQLYSTRSAVGAKYSAPTFSSSAAVTGSIFDVAWASERGMPYDMLTIPVQWKTKLTSLRTMRDLERFHHELHREWLKGQGQGHGQAFHRHESTISGAEDDFKADVIAMEDHFMNTCVASRLDRRMMQTVAVIKRFGGAFVPDIAGQLLDFSGVIWNQPLTWFKPVFNVINTPWRALVHLLLLALVLYIVAGFYIVNYFKYRLLGSQQASEPMHQPQPIMQSPQQQQQQCLPSTGPIIEEIEESPTEVAEASQKPRYIETADSAGSIDLKGMSEKEILHLASILSEHLSKEVQSTETAWKTDRMASGS
eukprot:Clim_evm9s224 gene=Clim_evmTU9s224